MVIVLDTVFLKTLLPIFGVNETYSIVEFSKNILIFIFKSCLTFSYFKQKQPDIKTK